MFPCEKKMCDDILEVSANKDSSQSSSVDFYDNSLFNWNTRNNNNSDNNCGNNDIWVNTSHIRVL